MRLRKRAIILFTILLFIPTFTNVSAQVSPVVLSNIELVTVDETSAAITWVTSLPADTRVQWGTSDVLGEEVIIEESVYYHMGKITGLSKGTEYFYRVGSDGRWSSIWSFTTLTPPSGGLTATFAIVADIHYDADGSNQATGAMYEDSPRLMNSAISELNSLSDLDFVVLTGDNTNGAQDDYHGFSQEVDELNVDWHYVLGNWDKNEENWDQYYEELTGSTETYYRIELDGYHLIFLDSAVSGEVTGSLDDTQLDWLESELVEVNGEPTMIFLHHLIDRTDVFGLDADSKVRLDEILDANPHAFSITSGHIHQNDANLVNDDARIIVTTASVVQYPIGYTIVKLYGDGYTQSFHKIGSELETSEESRLRLNTASGNPNADQEYLGAIEARSFSMEPPTPPTPPPPPPPNQPPIISSVSAAPVQIQVGGSSTITVVATDPDGDVLTYHYEVTAGSIDGSGASVTYRAPSSPGTYIISVKVSDGEYFSAEHSVDIQVRTGPINEAPEVLDITESSDMVKTNEVVELEATAEDPEDDTLTYHWSASDGIISGSGSKVEWQAPKYPGDFTIEVYVSDGEFDSDPKSVTISVLEASGSTGSDGAFGGLPGFEGTISVIAFFIVVLLLAARLESKKLINK